MKIEQLTSDNHDPENGDATTKIAKSTKENGVNLTVYSSSILNKHIHLME